MSNFDYKYIYHCHTPRCGHAYNDEEETVLAAINHGVKVLTFTDHNPIPGYPQQGIRMNYDELDQYIKDINNLKNKYKDQIEIHVALEVENHPGFNDYIHDYFNKGIEYIIIGQHMIKKNNHVYWNSTSELTKKEKVKIYVDSIIDALSSGLSKYVAHPDLIISSLGVYDLDIENELKRLLNAVRKYGAFIEINVHGVFNTDCTDISYPNIHFWKMVKEEFNDIKIVIGYDIHYLDEFNNPYALDRVLSIIKGYDLNIENRSIINEIVYNN